MPSLGFAVDAATAGGMWGWAITILLVLLFGAVGALGFTVRKLYNIVVGDLQDRLPVLLADMEALTESLVPKDEKGRPVHLKLAEEATKHYREHKELIDLIHKRNTLVDKMSDIAQRLDERLELIHNAELDKQSGDYWERCNIYQCPPLRSISTNVEEAAHTLEEMRKLLDEQSRGVQATREELHKALEESYGKFYDFLMGISKSMLETFREQGSRDAQ